MTNTAQVALPTPAVAVLVRTYVGLVVATLAVLVVLSTSGSPQATSEAWVHAVIVAVFAVLLPLRLRSATRGNRGALRAVGVISAVLLVVNAVESGLDLFPVWMRVEMVAVAILMAAIVALISVTAARHH